MKESVKMAIVSILCLTLLVTSSFCYNASSVEDAEVKLMSEPAQETFEPYMEDNVAVRIDTSDVTIVGNFNPSYTQEDVDTHFVHYASGDARISLPSVYTGIDSDVSNVVGVVLDFEADTPISGAVVFANGTELLTTDSDGRFQITNLPDGEYDWEVTADGYMNGSYLNYTVSNAGGTNIFRFYLSQNMEYTSDQKTVTYGSIQQETGILEESSLIPYSQNPNTIMSSVPDAYDSVLVKHNGVVKCYDRDDYLCCTIGAEQYGPDIYEGTFGLTEEEMVQVYTAQALVANTFIEFQQKIYLRHDGDYDILSGSDHAFSPNYTNEVVLSGVSGVFYTVAGKPSTVIMYYKPSSSTYQYLNAEWFSSCYNKGTIDNPLGWPGVEAKSCTDFFTGYGGHRRGYCQSGATQLIVVDGELAVPAAEYYFTDVDHHFAKLVPRPDDL